jgi:hypothetical protein
MTLFVPEQTGIYGVCPPRRLRTSHIKEKKMGRPLNKRYFGSGAGNQIKVRAKIGANAEGDGVIVSQRGSKKFKVTVDENTGDCFLVDKADAALGANEMTITVLTDAGQLVRAKKISAHRVTTSNGVSVPWNFSDSASDDAVQMEEVEDGVADPVITIVVQPSSITVDQGDPATFLVESSVTQGLTPTYQWESFDGLAWNSIVGETSDTLVVDSADVALYVDGTQFRVVVSATGAADVTSDAATLTITPV